MGAQPAEPAASAVEGIGAQPAEPAASAVEGIGAQPAEPAASAVEGIGAQPAEPAASAGAGRVAAFFDLDKTLIEGSSGVDFARAAWRAGMIGRRELLRDVWANVKFRVHGSTDEGSQAIRQRILDAIAGVPVKELKRMGPDVLAGVLPRVYPEMLRTAYDHQDAGRLVFIVTAASQELADVMAHVLVLDGGIGTRSEIINGIYTGRPDGPFAYRSGKAEAIARVAAEHGIDLSTSYAYSDSESDLPMLEAVGNPVAVNPDSALERIARERGWRIVRFDKLARRLRIAAAMGTLAMLGVGGGYLAARMRPPPRWRRTPGR